MVNVKVLILFDSVRSIVLEFRKIQLYIFSNSAEGVLLCEINQLSLSILSVYVRWQEMAFVSILFTLAFR